MGAAASEWDRGDAEALTWQQQRAQFHLVQQIQEARMLARNDTAPAAAALNSLLLPTLPPVDQPSLLMSQVLQNPAHVRGKTIMLTPGQQGESSKLRFSFDSLSPCLVTVYRSALLVPAGVAWEVESAAWSSPSVPFPAGLAQTHELEWEALWQSQALSGTFDSDARHCPLLVELRVEEVGIAEAEKGVSPSVEWTICQLLTATKSSGKNRVEVISQQLCNGGHQALEILELFGSEPTADGAARQDCIVCQSEPRDTAVLPCRHMCLCSRCSDYIRTRTQYTSYKCPICREKIGRMLRLDPASETIAACSSEEKGCEEASPSALTISV